MPPLLVRPVLLSALLLFIGCPVDPLGDDDDTGVGDDDDAGPLEVVTQLVTAADGGTIETADASLSIPAGALAEDTEITISVFPRPTSGMPGPEALGPVYELSPDGLTFDEPAFLTLTPPAWAPPHQLTVAFETEQPGVWEEVETLTGPLEISGRLDHFSSWSRVLNTGLYASVEVCVSAKPADCTVVTVLPLEFWECPIWPEIQPPPPGCFVNSYDVVGGPSVSASRSDPCEAGELLYLAYNCGTDPDLWHPDETFAAIHASFYDRMAGEGLVECLPDTPFVSSCEVGCAAEPDPDLDRDGTPDCIDECPVDLFKMTPGACGCGVREVSPCPDPCDEVGEDWHLEGIVAFTPGPDNGANPFCALSPAELATLDDAGCEDGVRTSTSAGLCGVARECDSAYGTVDQVVDVQADQRTTGTLTLADPFGGGDCSWTIDHGLGTNEAPVVVDINSLVGSWSDGSAGDAEIRLEVPDTSSCTWTAPNPSGQPMTSSGCAYGHLLPNTFTFAAAGTLFDMECILAGSSLTCGESLAMPQGATLFQQ